MYANHELFDRDGKKKNVRERLPAYAYSRGIELRRDDRNPYYHVPSEIFTSNNNAVNISYPMNEVSDFELPNEEQISCYEQLMRMSNGTIILNNFLENQDTQFFETTIQKKPESIQGQAQKYTQAHKCSSDTFLPFYLTCFEISKVPIKDTKWKLCLIAEHSTELRSEIQQIYLHMWLYYTNYMQKVDLGVLDTCNRMAGLGQPVTEIEQFYLTIRDDYLMASQILILFKNVSNQHILVFKQMIEVLEYWKSLIQKMSTNPKVYELSPYNISLELTEMLEQLARSYFKTRHCLEACFILMINKEGIIKEQQIKDEMLCKFWYSMVDSP